MSAPSTASLVELSSEPASLAPFAERVREIAASPAIARALAAAPRLPWGMRAPMIDWHLRALDDAAADLARLFVVGASIEFSRAARALGDDALAALTRAGVLSAREGEVRAALALRASEGGFVLADCASEAGAADAVGFEEWDASIASVRLAGASVQRVLHVGCGVLSSAFAWTGPTPREAPRATAVDERPRARALARLNAWISGLSLDLFDDVAALLRACPRDDTFDRIAVDVPSGPGRADALAELPSLLARLSPSGLAFVHVDGISAPDLGPTRAALAMTDSRGLRLEVPRRSADARAAERAAAQHPELGPAYARAYERLRDELERDEPGDTARLLAVLSPRRAGVGRASVVERRLATASLPALAKFPLLAALEASAIAEASDAQLLAAKVRLPAGARTRQGKGGAGEIELVLASPAEPVAMPGAQLEVLAQLHAAPSVAAAAEAIARRAGVPASAFVPQLLPAVRGALRGGLLEVAR